MHCAAGSARPATPSKLSTTTFESVAVDARMMASRSSRGSSDFLRWLCPTAMITSSNSVQPRRTMSMCPIVMGSKLPA